MQVLNRAARYNSELCYKIVNFIAHASKLCYYLEAFFYVKQITYQKVSTRLFLIGLVLTKSWENLLKINRETWKLLPFNNLVKSQVFLRTFGVVLCRNPSEAKL